MRLVLQRVRRASVTVGEEVVGKIEQGLLALVGIKKGDDEATVRAMAKKAAELRIFSDAQDKMNLSLLDVSGKCLAVSQFTLFADTTRGRRPFFGEAESPERAAALCELFVRELRALGVPTETGCFGAMMQVELVNDGPVTIVLDSP
jgi:D-tyrosyl-tRNA(Tyr) deacylase